MANPAEKTGTGVNVQKSSINVTEVNKDALEYMFQLGERQSTFSSVQKYNEDGSVPFIIVPGADGLKVVNLSEELKKANPDRKRINLEFFDVSSFVEYVNEHKSDSTRIFVENQQAPYKFTAIIDYHEPGAAGMANWMTHRASLILRASDEFSAWKGMNKKSFEQAGFVEFLKDRRRDIFTPSGATLMEIALTLEATTQSRVTSKVRTNTGIHIEFKEDVNAKAGINSSLDIPEEIQLNIPIFQGMPCIPLNAEFIFRINSGTLIFAYRLIEIDTIIQNAVKSTQALIRENTNLPCFIGKIV